MSEIQSVPVGRSVVRTRAARSAKTPPMSMTPRVRQSLAAAASQTPGSWSYILSASGTSSAPMVLNISSASTAPNTQIIVYALQPNSPNELWMLTGDGYIISSLKPDLCLTVVGSNVLSVPVTAFGDTTQLWSLGDNGTVVSQADNRVLTVGDDNNVGVADLGSPLGTMQIWSFYPSNPLTAILAQAPVPFPSYTSGDLAIAYSAIMSRLGNNQADFDLRTQYLNLAAPLGPWMSTILTMGCPDGVDSDDWGTVQQQLAQELTAAVAVQSLFASYTVCHLALFSSQEAILNKAIIDASLDVSTKTNSLFRVIVWSILYTLMQTEPDTAIVANIIQGGLNVAAAKKDGVVASNAFSVEISALWALLDEGFDEILQATALIETDILSDWGRLQAAYAEIIDASQGNLAWGAGMTAELVAASASGFQVAMLQALVPAKYQIFFMSLDEGFGNPPPSCQWTSDNQTFMVASASDNDFEFPEFMMTNDISGAVPDAFFYWGQGGWATPMAAVLSDSHLTLMLTNQTNRFVKFSVAGQSAAPVIAPWSSATITWQIDGGDSAKVTVSNSSGTTIVFFDISQDEGDLPVVDNQDVGGGWGLTTPVCYPSYSDAYGGSCQITIFETIAAD
jgi:hypothetical protein